MTLAYKILALVIENRCIVPSTIHILHLFELTLLCRPLVRDSERWLYQPILVNGWLVHFYIELRDSSMHHNSVMLKESKDILCGKP